MNNFELHNKVVELVDSYTAYQLGRMLAELQSKVGIRDEPE